MRLPPDPVTRPRHGSTRLRLAEKQRGHPDQWSRTRGPQGRDWSRVSTALTAVTALGALLFTGLSLQETRHQNAIAEQGQITDRYTKAVEQLGSPSLDVRLGGIYALERLMGDSPRDHPTVVEVLAAFARDHAPGHDPGRSAVAVPTGQAAGPRLGTDVQAALTVLGRHDHPESEHVDLAEAHLAGARLQKTNLRHADLRSADLRDADLSDADLRYAWLIKAGLERANLPWAELGHALLAEADLTRASLRDAHLEEAILDDADLGRANLSFARLPGAYMLRADLRQADLDDAGLHGARLSQANLQGATLEWADLRGTQLDHANLRGANLGNAHLEGASLESADLRGANLRFTKLEHVNLTAANLTAADLRGADLTETRNVTPAQLATARTDELTKLPPARPGP